MNQPEKVEEHNENKYVFFLCNHDSHNLYNSCTVNPPEDKGTAECRLVSKPWNLLSCSLERQGNADFHPEHVRTSS